MAEEIGPQMPPHLAKKTQPIDASNVNSPPKVEQETVYGPVIPVSFPKSPEKDEIERASGLRDRSDEKSDDGGGEIEKTDMTYGPALPPGLATEATKNILGPSLPPGWNPGNESEEDDEPDDLIGPVPHQAGVMDDVNQKRIEIEERALAMKNKITGKNQDSKILKRETWMTELPPELGANIGIVARTFKKRTLNSKEADRSVWTETPADRERKKKEQRERQGNKESQESALPSKRDLEMQQRVEEHNMQHRGKSLLELHQQELKKKKGSGPEERKAFNRDVDLNHRNVDKKAINAFMQKANSFNSKFENPKSGNKFL